MAKLEVLARQRRAVLCLSIHGSASEVYCLRGDVQVVSCHRYLVIFHPFVEQLTVFHTSGLVLVSSSILRVLDLNLHVTAPSHNCILSGTCQKMHKPVYFNRKPVMDRHTNIQAQPQTKALLAPAAPARL